tara:strand:- start:676 stop:1263 length:588 start_codon:yes stop_codon:yes gene_type:complete
VAALTEVPGRTSVFKVLKAGQTRPYYVLKRLKKYGTAEHEHAKMRSEIEMMRQVTQMSCPYIVKYVDDEEDAESISVFMEYFSLSLRDLILTRKSRREAFSDREIVHFMVSVAKGLEFLHNLPVPILHRDIKSDNIFLDTERSDCIVKIGDLGECALLNDEINYLSVAGTPGFMDASILQKNPVSVLADGMRLFF